jgi:hypothetical protein
MLTDVGGSTGVSDDRCSGVVAEAGDSPMGDVALDFLPLVGGDPFEQLIG